MRILHISLAFLLISCLVPSAVRAEPGRFERDLTGDNWTLRLDPQAEWLDDELFLPPVDLARLPVNPPTSGWDDFSFMEGKRVSVPGTVEEHYWGANGNSVGVAGDYRGVSWWSRTFTVDERYRGKRVVLAFEAVNLRAEIYVNRELAGYELIGNTPFEADITDAVRFGGENSLDIRITDPVGNFSWPAHVTFPWGKYNVPAVRGFGGITGKVCLRLLDAVTVTDVFVRNSPKITEADVAVSLANTSGAPVKGSLALTVHAWGDPAAVVWEKTVDAAIPVEGKTVSLNVRAGKAKPWDILQPNLYVAQAIFTSDDGGMRDSFGRRFGFRWLDMRDKDGDMRLYLNGRRIFIRGCKNREFWPENGMYASPEWAEKDVRLVADMGYNTIKVTNAIAQANHVRACEELGILYTGRSAGYRINGPDGAPVDDPFTREWRRINLERFVRRDRSSPALFLWSLKGEDPNPPDEDDFRAMEMIRGLDGTRIIVYNGGRDRTKDDARTNDPLSPAKSMYRPLDPKRYTHGWWDMHHWNHRGYRDDYYTNPHNYIRLNIIDDDPEHQVQPDEIIYYGEEGSFGSMMRLQKIREDIFLSGSADGWREREHLDWFDYYDSFLDESGFRSSFPTVDHLTKALGENLFYFHGRILENCRISNIIDAYIINGAASAATHTDMFGVYRNPTGEPSVLRRFMQPLYVAVKLRDKVLPVGYTPVADIFIVNELDLSGGHTLELTLTGPDGTTVFADTRRVRIEGGEEYGQLIAGDVRLPAVEEHGYHRLEARILDGDELKCDGYDDIFAVDYAAGKALEGRGAVIDDSGAVNALISDVRGVTFEEFPEYHHQFSGPRFDYIVVGKHDFDEVRRSRYRAVMEQVYNGATLIVLENTDEWAGQWDDVYWYQAVQYHGSVSLGSRGRFFVGKSPLLEGLPQSQAMGWEYQAFYYDTMRGLDVARFGHETVVALAAEHRKDIHTAVARIPFGRGQIVASTLDMLRYLDSDMPQSAIPKKLFLNFFRCADSDYDMRWLSR